MGHRGLTLLEASCVRLRLVDAAFAIARVFMLPSRCA